MQFFDYNGTCHQLGIITNLGNVGMTPDPFLEVVVHRMEPLPGLIGFSVGYENGQWRTERFAEHIIEWIPDFALNHEELKHFHAGNAVKLIKRAAALIYATEKFQKRGEFGEILLHMAIRQVFNTVPVISKIFFKTAPNDTVKGFDAVHVVVSERSLELWLGEAKFYKDINAAVKDVTVELDKHTETEYLRTEFIAIKNKIDPKWPHRRRLRKLLDENTSLDKIFDCITIPVFLSYESKVVKSHTMDDSDYRQAITDELNKHYGLFSNGELPRRLRIHLFLLPMWDKDELVKCLHKRLAAWQN